MYFNKMNTLIVLLGCAAMLHDANATPLSTGDVLTINAGIPVFDGDGDPAGVVGGSWFAVDANGNRIISTGEKSKLAQGTSGLVIGMTTSPGAFHLGVPTASDSNAITAPWEYFLSTGSDYVVIPVTGGTAGLDMRGWRVAWGTISVLNLGGDAWGTGYSDGVGNFNWSGVYGTSYTLDYRAAIPLNDPSGFGSLRYALHLEGVVEAAAVPEPASLALVGLGLLGLSISRRNRKLKTRDTQP